MDFLKPEAHTSTHSQKRKTGRQKERKNFPPLFGLVYLRLALQYFQRCCLLINDYYDNSPEKSSMSCKDWTLPCLISTRGLSPVCLDFSCFQFGLSTCAALVVYITMNISCCGLFCTLAASRLPVCVHVSLWISWMLV